MKKYLFSLQRNELTYWLGLSLLFTGLGMRVSVATACCVIGTVIVVESVLTSYLATWMAIRTGK